MVKWDDRLFFHYKYIMRVGEEKIVEDLGIGTHKWRVIEITKEIREATSESITYIYIHTSSIDCYYRSK